MQLQLCLLQLLWRVMPMSQVIIMERLELPVLVEVVRAETQLTLRLYEEVVDGVPNRRGRISGRAALETELALQRAGRLWVLANCCWLRQ